MRKGQGAANCPAWEGESGPDYIHRLAVHEGYWRDGSVPLGKREWPRDGRSQEERINAIFRGERDADREPGVEG